MRVDVIIPTLRPGARFLSLLQRLEEQTCPVNRVIVMNTEEERAGDPWDDPDFFARHPKVVVKNLKPEEFDHGATRNEGVALSDADIFVCMTQDALPADRELIRRLADALCAEGRIAVAYARQLPEENSGRIERFTRQFNYPERSAVKGKADLARLGIDPDDFPVDVDQRAPGIGGVDSRVRLHQSVAGSRLADFQGAV